VTHPRDSPDDGPDRETDPRELAEDSSYDAWIEETYRRLFDPIPELEAA
jgi:hypothetical protein